MTWQMYWQRCLQWLDAICVYFAEILGRSAMISILVITVILLCRKVFLRKKVFGRGMIWCLLVPVLFVGKLRVFYETGIGIQLFWWWISICRVHMWVSKIYMLGIVVFGIYVFMQRRRLKRFVCKLEPTVIGDRKVYISDLSVSPFTVGIFRARIVVPRTMQENFGEKELELVLLHEKIHVRLGHLWLYLFWDVLRILLWPNFLLTVFMKDFRSDMEDICDRVTIQRSQKTAYEYGSLLLKSLQLLKEQSQTPTFSATLTGETEYRNIKSRMKKVVGFQPYKRVRILCICAIALLFLAGSIWGVKHLSYPRYMKYEDIMLYDDTGRVLLLSDSPELRKAITVDDKNVRIDRAAMTAVLKKNHITQTQFYVGFGGFGKVPGIGGGGNAVYVDYLESDKDLVIPYLDSETDFFTRLFKYL